MIELTKLHEFTSLFKLLFHASIYIIIFNPFLIRFILSKVKSKKNHKIFVISGTLIEILAFIPTILLAVEDDIILAVMTVFFYYFADLFAFWPLLLLGIISYLCVKIISKRKKQSNDCYPINEKQPE